MKHHTISVVAIILAISASHAISSDRADLKRLVHSVDALLTSNQHSNAVSELFWLDEPDELAGRVSDLRVSDVMTEELVSIAPDASIPSLATLITENHVHRVLVVEDTADGVGLVGIVSVFDLVALLQ